LGLLQAGIEVVGGFDNWKDALNVYSANFTHSVYHLDLRDEVASVKLLKEISPDLIAGGPPCQDFSSAGKRNEDNGRGDLTVSYAKIVAEVHPEWFIMENVARIVKTNKLAEALSIFRDAGYGLTYMVIDASKCNVPQKRKRFVMIGRIGEKDDFIKQILMNNQTDRSLTMAEYFGPKLDIQYYYRHPRSYIRRGIFSIDEPSPTIRGVNRPMPKGYSLHSNDPVSELKGVRPLTTKERSMVQTFPEDFVFLGSKTDMEQMIGNAVPVNLGKFVGNAILQYIGQSNCSDLSSAHRHQLQPVLNFDDEHLINNANV